MKMRFSLCLIALGLTAQLVGQNNSEDVLVSLKESVPCIRALWTHRR